MHFEAIQPQAAPSPAVHPFPHHYRVTASAAPDREVALDSDGLGTLQTLPPAQFGGPGDHWSPETLLIGALSSCFVLTFRAIARARRLDWVSLSCEVEGVLAREQGNSHFTDFVLHARLRVPASADVELAEQLLNKAEHGCLVTNSLSGNCRLKVSIERVG